MPQSSTTQILKKSRHLRGSMRARSFSVLAAEHDHDPARAKQLAKITLPLQVPVRLQQRMQKLNRENRWRLKLPLPQATDLKRLEQEFTLLGRLEKQTKNDEHKLFIKKYRLALLKSYLRFLQADLSPDEREEEIQEQSRWKYYWKKIQYGLLLIAGILVDRLIDGIGSFLGSEEIVRIIPNLTNPMVIVISSALSFINAALFYSFEANTIKENLGLNTLDNIGKHLAIDEEEMEITEEINRLMKDQAVEKFSRDQYAARANFTETLNLSIRNKTYFDQPELKEKFSRRIMRYLITGLGALMETCKGYFMMKAFILALAPALMTTPAGPIIISVGIVTLLVYFFATQGVAMKSLLNPGINKFQEVKNKYLKFSPENSHKLLKHYDNSRDRTTVLQVRQENQELLTQNRELKQENASLKQLLQQNRLTFSGTAASPVTIHAANSSPQNSQQDQPQRRVKFGGI